MDQCFHKRLQKNHGYLDNLLIYLIYNKYKYNEIEANKSLNNTS